MTSNDLYYQILGLTPPWRVCDVKLDMAQNEVRIYVAHERSGRGFMYRLVKFVTGAKGG